MSETEDNETTYNMPKYQIMGDLLQHYSSRAVAHASFLVASVFGIVTFSAIIQQLDGSIFPSLSMPLFLSFSYAGYYTLSRFNYYANCAEKLATLGLEQDQLFKKIGSKSGGKSLYDEIGERTKWQEDHLLLRRILHGARTTFLLDIGYWIGVALLGLIAYGKSWDRSIGYVVFGTLHVSELFAVFFTLTLVFVVYPYKPKLQRIAKSLKDEFYGLPRSSSS